MFIEQIVISGFKSYKDQTVILPFSKKLNIIIGRNGSGKSNFFAAIRFVLSDAYTNMTREERQALLHEGTGIAAISAYVEIIFDNSDFRFPTGKEKVVLRRTIGLKKDEYSLDKKTVRKIDVTNLLESAGFSKANPYYIVPQGRITALTNAKDHERLALLREVAGTRVYEQKRIESLKIMEETEQKKSKINELLDYIQERLEELEEEKKELGEFQTKDRQRRCLEYSLYSKEQEETNNLLEELDVNRNIELEGNAERETLLRDREKIISDIEKEISQLQSNQEILLQEKAQLEDDKNEKIRARAHLELVVDDLSDDAKEKNDEKARFEQELDTIRTKINEKEASLAKLLPKYEKVVAKETELKDMKDKYELEQTQLYAKQGRNKQFKSQKERDQWLKSEIQTITASFDEQSHQLQLLESELDQAGKELARVSKEIAQAEKKSDDRRKGLSELGGEENRLRKERYRLDEERKNLWRKDAQSSQTYSSLKDQLASAKRNLESTMDRNTSSGLLAVKRISEKLGLTRNVLGPLYELFDVDEKYQNAVEVVAGSSLFHVVVDNDATATKILDVMNKEKCGRVTFMPLNRLKTKVAEIPAEEKEVLLMIQKLRFEAPSLKPLQHVFGKAVICANLDIADRCARNYGLNAVTMDGDRVGKRGEMTGGYHDRRKSRLECVKVLKRVTRDYEEEGEKIVEVQRDIQKVEQLILKVRDDQAKLERHRRELVDNADPLSVELDTRFAQQIRLKETIAQKEKSTVMLTKNLDHLNIQLQSYKNEAKQAFKQALDAREVSRLEIIEGELNGMRDSLAKLSNSRLEIEEQKNMIEITLNSNLKRRQLELTQTIEKLRGGESSAGSSSSDLLASKQFELKSLNDQLEKLEERVEAIDTELEEVVVQLNNRAVACDKAKNERQDEQRVLQHHSRLLEKYLSKKALLTKKKEECTRNIRELGVLPEEAFEKYSGYETKKLLKKLHQVNEALKKFGHVNKKAVEQYNNFTNQRDSLNKRKDELDISGKAIEDLIEVLDTRKNEAIQRTFKQVTTNFSDIWEKLVPSGTGELIMVKKNEDEQEEEEEVESDEEEVSKTKNEADKYKGVSINVSFNNKNDEGLRMGQLSGGQKSLVALALIFAIQRCDPAPFYLFDEIDAALDAQYRTAVANMVNELSENAQFICTTFRSEMLAHADKFYGVTFNNKVSKIQVITRGDAAEFVEQAQ